MEMHCSSPDALILIVMLLCWFFLNIQSYLLLDVGLVFLCTFRNKDWSGFVALYYVKHKI